MNPEKETKLQKYAEFQAMVQKDIETAFPALYAKEATKFGVAKTPLHQHNGLDSPKISEDNIVRTVKLASLLVVDTSETFTLRNVPNVSRISFHGFTANNADGTPATKRATITGEIIFGKCFEFTGSGSSIDVETNPPGLPFVQASDYLFIDTAAIANTRVGTGDYLAYATDSAGTVITSLVLDTYDNGNLQFTVVLSTNYKIQGNIIIE